jgi:hypothetical protein
MCKENPDNKGVGEGLDRMFAAPDRRPTYPGSIFLGNSAPTVVINRPSPLQTW